MDGSFETRPSRDELPRPLRRLLPLRVTCCGVSGDGAGSGAGSGDGSSGETMAGAPGELGLVTESSESVSSESVPQRGAGAPEAISDILVCQVVPNLLRATRRSRGVAATPPLGYSS